MLSTLELGGFVSLKHKTAKISKTKRISTAAAMQSTKLSSGMNHQSTVRATFPKIVFSMTLTY